ncbi:hypothetical protein [Oryzibacter oryziterrae]|uniref:hypothetical protein n=1 Tax=Oryzibacter oryziterrae TaxID=2766474 RepID=UPI001F3621D3|nr:hypothetical protein [Oryzibacter oryziterrae]
MVVAGAMYLSVVTLRVADTARFIDRRYADMRTTIQAAIDPRFQNKADEISRVAERLVVIDAIKGGALFDASGHLQETFGEPTETSFQSIVQTGRSIFKQSSTDRVEFYYSPETTGTPFHILVRVATGEITDLEALRDGRTLILVAIAGGAAATAMALIFIFFVAWPLRRIARTMQKTLADPASADLGAPLHTSDTEVGQIALAVERLRSSLAEIWRTKVMVADAILEHSPFPILQMSADGSPMFANPAANEIFARDVVNTFGTAPLVVRDIESGDKTNIKVYLDDHRDAAHLVEIPTQKKSRFALLGSLIVGAETRTPTTVAMASDVSAIHLARLKAEADLQQSVKQVHNAARREFELKLMLESCISLLGNGKAPEVHIDITAFAREWVQSAQDVDLIGTVQSSDEAPQVAGAREDLRAVVRLAILATYARLGTTPVDLIVDIKGISFETVGLVVTARPSAAGNTERSVADANLALAALRAASKRIGAQLGEVVSTEEATTLRMTLRGAAERMSTGMKAGGGGARAS